MLLTYAFFLLTAAQLAAAQQNCYRAETPFKSQCALPDLWKMRHTLCSSNESWGEGFPFLSGHGLGLRMQDNCTVDNAPLGIDLTMVISTSTLVKDREDCWNRTYHIIEKCVKDGYPEFNGGEWYDLVGEEETFIYMQYLHVEPPVIGDPYYNETEILRTKRYAARKGPDTFRGTFLDVDREGKILGL